MLHQAYSREKILIRASEIGQFYFCSASWYLQRCGFKPESPRLERGTQKHIALGGSLKRLEKLNKKVRFLRWSAFIIFLLALCMLLFEVIPSAF